MLKFAKMEDQKRSHSVAGDGMLLCHGILMRAVSNTISRPHAIRLRTHRRRAFIDESAYQAQETKLPEAKGSRAVQRSASLQNQS